MQETDGVLRLIVVSIEYRLETQSPLAGLSPEVPEDLYNLIKKAVSVRKHLQTNRSDKDAKFRLILIESRIHRLTRYYKRQKAVAPNFR